MENRDVAKILHDTAWLLEIDGAMIGRDDGPDVFVHHSSIAGEKFKTLREGDQVEFDLPAAGGHRRRPQKPASRQCRQTWMKLFSENIPLINA